MTSRFQAQFALLGAAVALLCSASPAVAQPFAYVLGDLPGNNLVTVIDTATNTKVASIPVGAGTPSLGGGGSIAASPDGLRVYVVNGDDESITAIDAATHTAIGSFPSGPEATTAIVSPDGARLYVGNGASGPSPTAIRVLSTATGAVIGSIPLGAPYAFATFGIAISADGRRLYVTGWSGMSTGNTVKVIDTAAGAVVATIPTLQFPTDIVVTPDGALVFVAQMTAGTGTVSAISTATNSVVAPITVGVNPRGLAVSPDGNRVFVANNGVPFSISIIGRATGTVVGSIPGQIHMRDVAFTPDGTRALATWDMGVALFNAVTNTSAGSIGFDPATEGTPWAIVVPPPPPQPPEPPTDLYLTSMVGSEVTLHWREPGAGSRPTGYLVEGGVTPGEVLATLPTGSSLPAFTFSAPAGVYYVRVRGSIGSVRGAPSNEIRIFVSPPLPPSAPEGLVGLVNGSSVALAWRNTFAGGAASAMILEVSGTVATALTLPPADTFAFAGVPPGTYTLSVRAANAFGTSTPSNPVTLNFPGACSGVPLAPEDVRVYKAGTRLSVYWNPAASGPAPTSFVLSVTGAFAGSFSATARTMSGVVGPGVYHLSVAGSNACGLGPATAEQTVTVP